MDHSSYVQSVQEASDLTQRGEYDAAAAILRDLLLTDISDVDKSMMCLNLAIICEKTGNTEDALDWFAAGVEREQRHGRFFVAEHKAALLAKLGRDRESLAEYDGLLDRAELTENDRERIRQNIDVLNRRIM